MIVCSFDGAPTEKVEKGLAAVLMCEGEVKHIPITNSWAGLPMSPEAHHSEVERVSP